MSNQTFSIFKFDKSKGLREKHQSDHTEDLYGERLAFAVKKATSMCQSDSPPKQIHLNSHCDMPQLTFYSRLDTAESIAEEIARFSGASFEHEYIDEDFEFWDKRIWDRGMPIWEVKRPKIYLSYFSAFEVPSDAIIRAIKSV